MRKILTLTMSGLATVLPLALTIYVIWWLVNTVEGWLRRALLECAPPLVRHHLEKAPLAPRREDSLALRAARVRHVLLDQRL